MIHKVLMPDGMTPATCEAWMIAHPGFNAGYETGDLIDLEEGIFVLDDELVPWRFATDEEIDRAIEET
ncbi:hypothetical protein [Microcystis aeruginosa]|nr:hypothetical protein [Microcystis aeruginosa]